MEIKNKQNLFSDWLSWHFYLMPKFLFGVWKNYILFASNYFSLPVLLKSLFAPWRKYKWMYPKGFDLGEFFSTLISNLFSRLIGAFIRVILIAVGVFFQVFVIFAGLIILSLWILVPFMVVAGFLFVFIY